MESSITITGILLSLFHGLGLLSAIDALLLAKAPQSALAWSLSLVTFPYLALPLYWVFGRTRFKGYRELIAEFSQIRAREIAAYEQHYRQFTAPNVPLDRHTETVFEHVAGDEFTAGNHLTLLIDGKETFDAIIAAIDEARDYVLTEFYIFRDDDIGRRYCDALARAAQRGVRAHLLYDEVGSSSLPADWEERMSAKGIEARAFETRRGFGNFFQVNFRNHRKIVVVDGLRAFVGGHNVGDEYLGQDAAFGRWRDTHIELRGPAVFQVQRIFLADWLWASGDALAFSLPQPHTEGTCKVLPVATGPADETERCTFLFLELIHAARKRLWIATPYLVPPESIIQALQMAALRGVDVRIILPAKPDHLVVWLASFVYIAELLHCGVKIFSFQNGFLHQKAVLVDDSLSAIGTVNLDNRSLRLNFEVTVLAADAGFAQRVEGMLREDMKECSPLLPQHLAEQPFYLRLGSRLANLFSPIL